MGAWENTPLSKKQDFHRKELIAWVQENSGTLARMRAQQLERTPKLPPRLPDGFPAILSQRGAAGPGVAARPPPPGWTVCSAPRWEAAASPRSRLRGRRNLHRCLPCPVLGGRSRHQEWPERSQEPPPPGWLLSLTGEIMSYWNKWYQRTADEKMGAVIARNFLGGNLVTLRYAKPDRVTDQFVARNWKAWLDHARILHGGPFRYIVGHDYGTMEKPAMVHHVFLDAAASECEYMAASWVCGPAAITHLDEKALAAVLSELSRRPIMERRTSRPLWGTSRKVLCEMP